MKVIFIVLFCSVTFHTLSIQSAWSNKRLLYIFGLDRNAIPVKHQLVLLSADKQGCEERDIEIIVVSDSPQRDLLQRKYSNSGDAFMIILVGKDGSEKHRSTLPVNPQELFSIIDAMPLRKYEIRSNR
jgi:hypothetical protein